jgi:2-polyprenyl-6-methoxyphenol hydroxylase-like FAD-dependent oxidoreductase
VELAREVTRHGPGAVAFDAFERRRRPRVEALIRTARRNGSRKAPGPLGRVVRDLTLPLFLRLGAAQTAAAYRHDTPPLPAPVGHHTNGEAGDG